MLVYLACLVVFLLGFWYPQKHETKKPTNQHINDRLPGAESLHETRVFDPPWS